MNKSKTSTNPSFGRAQSDKLLRQQSLTKKQMSH